MVAKVFVRGDDMNARMIRSGYAWAYRRYLRHAPADEHYCRLEAEARTAGRGVWVGSPETWEPPWDFRNRGRASDVPAIRYAEETQEQCLAAIGRRSADPACRIKGNINSRGERIYHVPSASSYTGTRIAVGKGERWFCSEDEAIRAGWRAPR